MPLGDVKLNDNGYNIRINVMKSIMVCWHLVNVISFNWNYTSGLFYVIY